MKMTEISSNSDTAQKAIKRRAYYWNTASGMINAAQSAVILIFIAHFLGKIDAGIFTIGIALGNLVSVMGKYGMRNYQVTDVNDQYSFNQYFTCRLVTSISTILLCISYLVYQYLSGNYSCDKALIVFIICSWKLIDSIEDVYFGMYQQKGRLDIGAKYHTIRVLISSVLLCGLVTLKYSLLLASATALISSIIMVIVFVTMTLNVFNLEKIKLNFSNLGQILFVCFPLFLAATLSIYIGNSPKYLIDVYLDDNAQAIFGYLMMPAFTIMVINQFIYQPIIKDLGDLWQNPDKKPFVKRVLKQYLIVAAITLVVVIGGATVGLPILSAFYNTDLRGYRVDFIILLLGGGVHALSSFIMVPITAMRLQKLLAYGFISVSIASILLGPFLINRFDVKGATLLYLFLNILLATYLTACFLIGSKKAIDERKDPFSKRNSGIMIRLIERCRYKIGLCYQSKNAFASFIGKVVFRDLCFFYFYVRHYTPSDAGKIANSLVVSGRVKDFKATKKDILKWYTFYRYEPWEYAAYHFENKSKKERLSFYSDLDRLRFGSVVNNIIDCRKLNNKLQAYNIYKDAFKREMICIESEADFSVFQNFCNGKDAFFAKPLAGSYGVNSSLIKIDTQTDLKKTFDDLINIGPYVLEEPIKQCQEMASLNPDSVNTLRLATLLTGDKVDFLFSYVRCGRKGVSVDNSGAGGFLASVDLETGVVFTDGYAKGGSFVKTHYDSGVIFKGFKVPRFEEAKALACDLAKRLPSVRYVGWDLAITDDGVVVVEANSFAMMSGCQFSTNTGKKEYFESFLQNKA